MSDNISMNLTKAGDKVVSLKISDSTSNVNYMLSDLSVISTPPNLKSVPDFEVKIKVDKSFMSKFVAGKGALADVETFAVNPVDGGLEFVIGYSDINSNRISIKVQSGAVSLTDPVVFNANLFKEVLNANKECSKATLQISDNGLAHIEFNVDDFNVKYWLVSQQV